VVLCLGGKVSERKLRLARKLGCPTTEEPPLESSGINHIRQFVREAAYRRHRLC
jgi:hypothetical protein